MYSCTVFFVDKPLCIYGMYSTICLWQRSLDTHRRHSARQCLAEWKCIAYHNSICSTPRKSRMTHNCPHEEYQLLPSYLPTTLLTGTYTGMYLLHTKVPRVRDYMHVCRVHNLTLSTLGRVLCSILPCQQSELYLH